MSAFLRKYNTATSGGTNICIPLPKAGSADFATGSDFTPSTGDVKISIDSGAQANIGTLPTYTNGQWSFTLTGGETTGKRIVVMIVDSATKAVDDQCFIVETFGNASAMYQFDPTDTVRAGLTALPNVASGSAGALLVDGTGTAAISNSAGKVLLQATQTGVTIPTVTAVTNQLTAAAIATGVWQDTTAGDFTVASSIGKSLYTTGAVPGAAGGLQIAGSNAATTYATLTVTSGQLAANVTQWSGTNVAAVDTAGYPKVTVKSGTGTGEISLSSGRANANVTHFGGTAGTFSVGQPYTIVNGFAGTTLADIEDAVWLGTGDLSPVGVTVAADAHTASLLSVPNAAANATAVWANAARTLTAGTNIVLAKGTGITGFNDLSAAQVNAEADTALSDVGLTATITGRIDAAVSSRMASFTYTAPPTAAAIGTEVWTTNATGANVATAATRFLTMIALDGSVYQFTANALELGPSGGGGGGSLTADQAALLQSGTQK